jgi:dienelactone hydrolase
MLATSRRWIAVAVLWVCAFAGPGCSNSESSRGGSGGATAGTGGAGAETSSSDAGDAGPASDLTKPGPYAVGHVSYMLSDTSIYSRPVFVSVWYPGSITATTSPAQYLLDPWSSSAIGSTSTEWETLGYDSAYEGPSPSTSGPFPLIVLSPGWGGYYEGYLYIGTRLASHGFVVAVIGHSESDGTLVEAMFNRPRDVSFAITELLLKNNALGELLQGVIDPARIASSGHSLGGYVAYVLAGGDETVCDDVWDATYAGASLPYPQFTCAPTPSDSRIGAIVSLDGSSQYLRYDELAKISVPSLILGETVEHSGITDLSYFPPPQPSDPNIGLWIARPHAAISHRDSYRVDIKIANHLSFTNYCGGIDGGSGGLCAASGTFDPKNNRATHQIVTTYMLAFLNTYFGRENDAWMLTSSYAVQNQPQAEFFDSEECDAPPPTDASLPSQDYYTYQPHLGECLTAPKDPPGYFAPPASDAGAQ